MHSIFLESIHDASIWFKDRGQNGKKILSLLNLHKVLFIGIEVYEIAADVAKLVDALDLGSSGAIHGGSSPSIRTKATLDHDFLRIKKGIEIEGFCY